MFEELFIANIVKVKKADYLDDEYDRRHKYDTKFVKVIEYRGYKIALYKALNRDDKTYRYTTENNADKIYFDNKKSLISEEKAIKKAKQDIDKFIEIK